MSNTLFKKAVASAAALSIVLSVVSPVVGVNAADSSVDAANRLAALGIINNNSENPSAYRLNDSITRGEMAKVMLNLAGEEPNTTCEGKFSDVSAKTPNDWVCGYVEKGLELGFLSANSKFRPNDSITEAETLKMVMEALGVGLDTYDAKTWVADLTSAAVEAGVVSETTKVSGVAAAKRSFVFTTADAGVTATDSEGADTDGDLDLDDLFGDLFGDGSGSGATSTGTTSTGTTSTGADNNTQVKAGNLEVSLNPGSPANGTEVPGTGSVLFAKVDFTAGASDVSLNTLELKKVGLGNVNSDNEVWFEVNGKKVSSEVSFNNEGTAVVSFAPAYVVKAGSTETLDLYVGLQSNAGVDYQFASSTVNSSALNVSGSFVTPKLRTANYTVNNITFDSVATTQNYKASSDLIDLGAFRLTNNTPNGKSTTDVNLNSVSLYLSGSASLDNLSNFQLVRDGVVVSTSSSVNGRYLTLVVDKNLVKSGLSAIYYVKANVSKVENSTDTYQLRLRDDSDLNVTEATNGFRTLVNSSSVKLLTVVNVTGGETRLERDSTTALDATYAPGSSEVVLLKGTITAKNQVKLKDVTLSGATTLNLGDLFNTIYLSIGNSVISATPTNSGVDLNFKGTVYVQGTQNVKVYGNLKGTATGSFKIGSMTAGSFVEKEYVSNQQSVEDMIGSISSINVKVQDSVLNVARNDSLGDTTVSSPSEGVLVYGAQFTSTKGNPINLNAATFGVTYSGSANQNVYATLYVNGNAVSSKLLDGSTVRFEGFNAKVSKDSAVNIQVKANLYSSFTAGSFKLTLNSVDAIDSETGKSVSASSTPVGALISVKAATSTVASTDASPKATLIKAGQENVNLFSFRVNAKNDKLQLDDVSFTGTNLDKFSNYRLFANGKQVGVANSISSGSLSFDDIASVDSEILVDKFVNFTVQANANYNSTGSVELAVTKVSSNSSNGTAVVATGTGFVSATHFLAENTLLVTQNSISTPTLNNALSFKVTAYGKDEVTLSGMTANITQAVGYTGTLNSSNLVLYKNSVSNDNLVNFASGTNVTVTAGGDATFILVVSGATLNPGFTGTPSLQLELSDLETTEIPSVKVYENAGLKSVFVSTVK
ncbi:S-layer homology domain-containing protein [Candidatus Gracilibacteria bacterium]|nr:S-layer homology domain-containing protein [Candidatus Gracilibacteria bacterium]